MLQPNPYNNLPHGNASALTLNTLDLEDERNQINVTAPGTTANALS